MKMKKRLLCVVLALSFVLAFGSLSSAAAAISVCVDGRYLNLTVSPRMEDGKVLVPMRPIFESLDAKVDWNAAESKITATKGDTEIILIVGSTRALINGAEVILEVAARTVNGNTLVPLRFVGEALNYPVEWVSSSSTVFIGEKPAGPPYVVRSQVVNNRSVQIVEITPGALTVGVHIANNRIGSHQSMQQMVQDTGAVIAINGAFFDAYTTEGYYAPYGTLIRDGKLIHRGDYGTTVGFNRDGRAVIGALLPKIEGSVNGVWGWPGNWYAYGLNRRPATNGAFIYTREWGSTIGLTRGVSVAVENGVVTRVVRNADLAIPANGYAMNFCGSEEGQLGDRFKVGDTVEYRVVYDNSAFDNVVSAVGAGPRLVRDGVAVYDPVGEGFVDTKILTDNASRSAIGIKSDGTIVLATTTATVRDLSDIMRALGCVQAMNLDGGASSGLYAQGRFLTSPGRLLSNILYFK